MLRVGHRINVLLKGLPVMKKSTQCLLQLPKDRSPQIALKIVSLLFQICYLIFFWLSLKMTNLFHCSRWRSQAIPSSLQDTINSRYLLFQITVIFKNTYTHKGKTVSEHRNTRDDSASEMCRNNRTKWKDSESASTHRQPHPLHQNHAAQSRGAKRIQRTRK